MSSHEYDSLTECWIKKNLRSLGKIPMTIEINSQEDISIANPKVRQWVGISIIF